MTDIVIGSGPAGVSVSIALLTRGRHVTMVDCGKMLESDRALHRDALAASTYQSWDESEIATYQMPQFNAVPGQVRRFGSDFAMEPSSTTMSENNDPIGLRASRAAGGLSNLWGAAVLPYRQSDIDDWPITTADLAPHYRAVCSFLPMSGTTDDLAQLFPDIDMAGCTQITPTRQAEVLLARLGRKQVRLQSLGVRVGAARQAAAGGCVQCGMCLHGCPWGYIYSAAQTLETLRSRPDFTYRGGTVALGFSEDAGGVEVAFQDGTFLRGSRLFIAAGVLESAKLLLASQPIPNTELVLRDSRHAFLPMVSRWQPNDRPDQPPLHTMPQVFLELSDPSVSKRLIHSQIYTWNEYFARDLIANYGRRLPFSGALFHWLARRLMVAQIFLHSDDSGRIALKLAPDGRLDTRVIESPDSLRIMKTAASKIGVAIGAAGVTALGFARRDGGPGSSFHVGGSVPMAETPGPAQSDRLGRPHGLERVHLVDASVLPSIPATTITLSVMANAHRIGSHAP